MLALMLCSLMCPQAVELGSEVEVCSNSDGGALRVEPSVGIAGETILVAWNDSYGGKHGSSTGTSAAWALSKDGGKTFSFGGYLTRRGEQVCGADTRIARSRSGKLFLAVLAWFDKEQEIRLYRLDGDKLTDRGQVATNGGLGYLDKPDLAIDGERLFLAYTNTDVIEVAHSADGTAWSRTIVSSAAKSARSGSGIAVRGDRVVVGWFEGGGMDLDRCVAASSTDQGKTFTAPSAVFKRGGPIPTPAGFRMAPGPATVGMNDVRLKFDDKGVVWLATLDVAQGKPTIVLFSSRDGSAWTPVDQRPAIEGAFFPDLAIVGGVPIVLSYGVANGLTHCCLLRADQRIQLSTAGTDWQKTAPDQASAPIQRNFGDYISLATQDDRFAAAWTDGRGGVPRIRVRTGRLR
jgi:hypothetical protein